MGNKVFLLSSRVDVGYDEPLSSVVVAYSKSHARELMQKDWPSSRGYTTDWTDPKQAKCEQLSGSSPIGVYVTDIHEG